MSDRLPPTGTVVITKSEPIRSYCVHVGDGYWMLRDGSVAPFFRFSLAIAELNSEDPWFILNDE